MNINVRIERLVLEGLDITHDQRAKVIAAVETELTHLLTEGGLTSGFQSETSVPVVRANQVNIGRDTPPDRLGRQIAEAVYGGIGR